MANDDNCGGGSRRIVGDNGYSSSEDCISPIMSQETFEVLHNTSANLLLDLELFRDLDPNNVLIGREDGSNTRVTSLSQETNPVPMPALNFEDVVSTWNIDHPVVEPKADLQQPGHSGGPGSLNESQFSNNKGRHGFDVVFNETENLTKSTPWTYSKILDMLLVSLNVPCPVQFLFNSSPPFGSVIRATPYFKEPVDFQRPVLRCLNHQVPSDLSNKGFNHHLEHILRCDYPGVDYHTNPSSGRLSVVVPYPEGRDANSFMSFNYFFVCFSSCIGGINRRPIVVVFTLEHGNTVIGQRALEVRVCASPGRDRPKAESRHFKNLSRVQGNVNRQNERNQQNMKRANSEIATDTERKPPPKKKKPTPNENDDLMRVSIDFMVRGKKNAETYQTILNSIRNAARLDFGGDA